MPLVGMVAWTNEGESGDMESSEDCPEDIVMGDEGGGGAFLRA